MPTNAEMLKVAEGMQAALQEINEAVTELKRDPAMRTRHGRLCVEVAAITDGQDRPRCGNDDCLKAVPYNVIWEWRVTVPSEKDNDD